ncbi:hypothetical protein BGZ95_007270, partial [Linnemannia exigua]
MAALISSSTGSWAYFEHNLEVVFHGAAYLEKGSGSTVFFVESRDCDGAVKEPKLVFTDDFYEDKGNAGAFDRIIEWWKGKRFVGVRAIVSGKMALNVTNADNISETLQVATISVIKESIFRRKRPMAEMPSFSMRTQRSTKEFAC